MQRPANPALRALTVSLFGFLKRLWVHRNHGVQLVFVGRYSRQILQDDLPGGDTLLFHGGLHLRNRCLDDAEGLSSTLRIPDLGEREDCRGNQE